MVAVTMAAAACALSFLLGASGFDFKDLAMASAVTLAVAAPVALVVRVVAFLRRGGGGFGGGGGEGGDGGTGSGYSYSGGGGQYVMFDDMVWHDYGGGWRHKNAKGY